MERLDRLERAVHHLTGVTVWLAREDTWQGIWDELKEIDAEIVEEVECPG